MAYGEELIFDLHGCDASTFNRDSIEKYFNLLVALIGMEACDLHFWDDEDVPPEERQTEPHLKGTSAIQFIMTSNITIHALDLLGNIYINVFSCKLFSHEDVVSFSERWFGGKVVQRTFVERK